MRKGRCANSVFGKRKEDENWPFTTSHKDVPVRIQHRHCSTVARSCDTSLAVARRHLQHAGAVHTGVLTTLADHTAGAAAQTLAAEGFFVATAELKISLLRTAKGERIVCRGRVVKPGKSVSFVEADICCVAGGEEFLAARLSATMVFVNVKNLA